MLIKIKLQCRPLPHLSPVLLIKKVYFSILFLWRARRVRHRREHCDLREVQCPRYHRTATNWFNNWLRIRRQAS